MPMVERISVQNAIDGQKAVLELKSGAASSVTEYSHLGTCLIQIGNN